MDTDAPTGPLAGNTLIGGHEADGTPLFPCLAVLNITPAFHATILGTTQRDWNACDIPWQGGERLVEQQGADHYLVLVPVTVIPFPHSFFVAGTWVDGENEGICLSTHSGGVQPGQYIGGQCTYGFANTEVQRSVDYSVLAF